LKLEAESAKIPFMVEATSPDLWVVRSTRNASILPERPVHYSTIPTCPEYRPARETAYRFGEVYPRDIKPQRIIDLMNDPRFMEYAIVGHIYYDRLTDLAAKGIPVNPDDVMLAGSHANMELREQELIDTGWKHQEIIAATSVARGSVIRPILDGYALM
jgi:hypothetical protein